MATFSLVIACDEGAEAVQLECASPTAAIGEARSFLAGLIKRLDTEVGEVAAHIGEGALKDSPRWLGVWEWSQRSGWRWSPRRVCLS